MSCMTWMFNDPKYFLYWIRSEMMIREPFYQRLYSTWMKNAGIILTWQMESYQHAVMQKKLWSTYTCKFLFVMYIFGVFILFMSCFVFFLFSKDIEYVVLFMLLGRDCSHRQRVGQMVAAILNFHVLFPCRTRCLNWGKFFDCIMILKWW